MKVVIRLSAEQELKALPIIITHSPGMMLPNRTYVLSEDVVRVLKKKRIKFKELGREAASPITLGADSGERI